MTFVKWRQLARANHVGVTDHAVARLEQATNDDFTACSAHALLEASRHLTKRQLAALGYKSKVQRDNHYFVFQHNHRECIAVIARDDTRENEYVWITTYADGGIERHRRVAHTLEGVA